MINEKERVYFRVTEWGGTKGLIVETVKNFNITSPEKTWRPNAKEK